MNTNLTVDDILNELKAKSSKGLTAPVSDMQQVDKIVFGILAKRREDELGKDRKDMSLREKKELEQEIKRQTNNLAKELAEIKKQSPEYNDNEPISEQIISNTQEIKLARLAKQQKLKYRDTSELELSQEMKIKRENKLNELKKVANEQHIIKDMKNITDHFGRFKMEDGSVDEGYAKTTAQQHKTDISQEHYREYKNSRNKKIDAFVLEHKKSPDIPQEDSNIEKQIEEKPEFIPETIPESLPEAKPEEKIQAKPETDFVKGLKKMKEAQTEALELDELRSSMKKRNDKFDFSDEIEQKTEYEYTNKGQTGEVLEKLIATQKGIKISFVALLILLIPTIALFFLKFHTGEAGGFSVPVSMYSFIHMGILLLATIFSYSIFSNSIQSIAEHKPDKDILYSITLAVSLIFNIFVCFKPISVVLSGVTLYTPIIVIMLFVNFFAKFISINRIIKNFKFISSKEEKCGLLHLRDEQLILDMTKGVVEEEPELVKNVKIGFFNDFLKNSFRHDLSDTISTKIAIYSLPAAILLGVIAFFVTKEPFSALTVASGAMLMLTSFIGTLFVTLPINDTAGVVNHFSGMMPEYAAIDSYKNTNAIMLDAKELLPTSSVVLHGIKTFQGGRIDDAIIDAASVVKAANSVLSGVFLSIINDNESLLRPVDSIIYEDLMGVSAWVDGKRVLIGNRELMINHSIAVPKPEYEEKYRKEGNEIVFLSNGGELCAAFIIAFTPDRLASDIVNLLAKNDIAAAIKTVDSCVSAELIAKVYEADKTLFKIIPARLHKSFEQEHKPQENADTLLGNNGSAFGYIVSIVACKKLSYCTKLGGFIYIISSILGVLLLFGMNITKIYGTIGNIQMLIFMVAFAVAYWIYEKNIKL